MAAQNSTRSKVSLIVIAVLCFAFAAYGFANFNETVGLKHRGVPGWLFGGFALLIAGTATFYLLKAARGYSIET